MGWWSAQGSTDVVIGDAVLDSVRHFLHDFSLAYQEDLSRRPSLQELEYALDLEFKANLDNDVLAGFDELEVKQVSIKTAKRRKRQKVTPGDIFSYRLDDGRFGFGRIVANVSIGAIAEIFDYFSRQPIFDHSKEKTWLVPPVPIESYSLLEVGDLGDWRIIEHQTDFVPGDEYATLRYVYGTPPFALTVTDIYENERDIDIREAEGLPKYAAYDDFNFKKMIVDHLKRPDV